MSALALGESLGVPRGTPVRWSPAGRPPARRSAASRRVRRQRWTSLAPIAGALLQKDAGTPRRSPTSASAPEGAVFDAADAALELMEHPR